MERGVNDHNHCSSIPSKWLNLQPTWFISACQSHSFSDSHLFCKIQYAYAIFQYPIWLKYYWWDTQLKDLYISVRNTLSHIQRMFLPLHQSLPHSNYIILSHRSGEMVLSFGPWRKKTCLRGFANNTGADQPAHTRSLISTFVIRVSESTISKLATSEISVF